MYKLIQSKKLLAVLGVLLMIAFVATLGFNGPGGTSRSEVVVGHIGKTPVYDRQMQNAKDEWSLLMQIPVTSRQFGGRQVPLPYAVLPMAMVQDIDKHPELFLLLQNEAEQNGVRITEDDARTVWVNQLHLPVDSMEAQRGGIPALGAALAIVRDYRRLGDVVKISQPVWRHQAAEQYQSVRLSLVDYRADEFEKAIPKPTAQQLQQQFDRYKDIAPRPPAVVGEAPAPVDPRDALGFGYRVPARVKLQYVEIPRAQVVQSLNGTPDQQYQWAVKAAEYYRSHPDEFRNAPPATEPATEPTTEPASEPATQSGAVQPTSQNAVAMARSATQPANSATEPASKPAIKPFNEVKAQIIQKLLDPEVDKQMTSIQNAVIAQFNQDWIDIRRADPAATQPAETQPSSAAPEASANPPATQPAGPRMTLAHLEQLRTEIQQKYHVSIELHEINNWQDEKQLGQIPGIGTAHTTQFDRFPEYALTFTGESTGVTAVPMQVWESSQALTDTPQNAYLFRLTAADPPHAPPAMAPIAKQVEQDWRTAQAYDQAKQAAQKLLDAAKSVGLAQAARTGSLQLITTGDFSPSAQRPIPSYPLNDATARQNLGQGAQKLLEDASGADKHPDRLIELPTAGRVVVAELAGAQLVFPEWLAQVEVSGQERIQRMQTLADQWFAYNAVVARMQYTVVKKEQQEGA